MQQEAIKAAEANPELGTSKSGRRRKKGKRMQKGETYKITWAMLNEGLRTEEIASKREMAVSTIEGHIAKGISAGELRILDLISEEVVDEVAEKLRSTSSSLSDVQKNFKGKYSYGVLRMVQAHIGKR